MNRNYLIAATITVGLAFVARPTFARPLDPSVEFNPVSVTHADLDLRNLAGAKILLKRIHAAATTACRPVQGDTRIYENPDVACEQDTIKRAVAALSIPLVTAIYEDRRGARAANAPQKTAAVAARSASQKPADR